MQDTTEHSTEQIGSSPDKVVMNINDDDMCLLENEIYEKENQDYEINVIKDKQEVAIAIIKDPIFLKTAHSIMLLLDRI